MISLGRSLPKLWFFPNQLSNIHSRCSTLANQSIFQLKDAFQILRLTAEEENELKQIIPAKEYHSLSFYFSVTPSEKAKWLVKTYDQIVTEHKNNPLVGLSKSELEEKRDTFNPSDLAEKMALEDYHSKLSKLRANLSYVEEIGHRFFISMDFQALRNFEMNADSFISTRKSHYLCNIKTNPYEQALENLQNSQTLQKLIDRGFTLKLQK
jgi:hypothetical protein